MSSYWNNFCYLTVALLFSDKTPRESFFPHSQCVKGGQGELTRQQIKVIQCHAVKNTPGTCG